VFVVERQGVLAARLSGPEVAEITRFAVAPEAVGRQVGRRLFEVAEGALRRDGAALLCVRLSSPAPAHHRAFLKRRGLRPVAPDLWVKGLRL
jgi:GNAT superfamily N-acetyltransferase